MKLENLNLVELNTMEKQETNGGDVVEAVIGVVLGIIVAYFWRNLFN